MKKLLWTVSMQFVCLWAISQIRVTGLLCENLAYPIGIDAREPRLTWQLVSDKRDVRQTAYAIRVTDDPRNFNRENALVWNSGKVMSDSSVQVVYKGTPLKSGKKYYWEVRVWDINAKASPWSLPAEWQMGMLLAGDWKAKWIETGFEDPAARTNPLLRKDFSVSKKIVYATAFITCHGLYEAFINGQRIGEAYLTPGWTSYNKRLQYQTYDVTSLLQNGANAIGVGLGSGWYRGFLAWGGNKNVYGKDLSLLLELDIVYADGTKVNIVSDDSWKSSTGAISNSEIYDGEITDARNEKPNWNKTGYNDHDWKNVVLKDFDKSILVATQNEPIKRHETFKPLKILTTPKGEQVIDFGQNLVGFVTVKVKGSAGDTVRISHAEVLDKFGNFYTDNLRAAKEQDIYVLKGGGEESFEPHFTFQGFRYIKVEGIVHLDPENFVAVALYSDMRPTGSFTCSNPLVNQLQHNIQWGQKGNFLDVPTDCPQRDERLGWTGDAQVFSRTATFNMNANNFFAKWLKDVAADQFSNGSVPFVVPNVLGADAGGSTGWADVATIIPWNVYLAYGDRKVLADQYKSMKAWVDYMTAKSKNDLWNSGFHFGDWLFYRPDDDNDGRSAVTDKYLIAQCFYANSTQLLINAAKVLNQNEDITTYSTLLEKIKTAFVKEYMTPNGRLVSGTQTAYVLALNFDMLPESLRAQAAERLAANVKDYDDHLTTGFLGTPYLCHVLSRFGYIDVAFKLLLQDTYPSWLYPVKMGATTIWERWDGVKPDSTFETPSMNSFNHYSYGAIGDWMYRVIAGIDTYADSPGYKHIKIMPHPGGDLTEFNATLQTYYGKVSSSWKNENGQSIFEVTIPCNTSATIFIPAVSVQHVTEGGLPLDRIKEIVVEGTRDGCVITRMGSGVYHFVIEK
jgi:alpha-L-rhamnosidase